MHKKLNKIERVIQGFVALCMLLFIQTAFADYIFPTSMPPGCSGGNGNYTCNNPPMNDHWYFDGDNSRRITVTINGNVQIFNYTFGRDSDLLNDGSRSSRVTLIINGDVVTDAPSILVNLELHGTLTTRNGNLPALRGAIYSPDPGRPLTIAGGVNYVRSDFGDITIGGGSGTGISSNTCIQATSSQRIFNGTNNWPSGSGVCCGDIDGTCTNACVTNINGATVTPPACRTNTASLVAKYDMEETTTWTGQPGELKDKAGSSGGPYNGQSTGGFFQPVQGLLNPARAYAATGTCQYAQFNGPVSFGGAFTVNNLSRNTAFATQNSVTFWMYWNGDNFVMPIGWDDYSLWFNQNTFGFNTNNWDVYGIDATSLRRGWHHVSAVFTNRDVRQNRLYIDGQLQNLRLYSYPIPGRDGTIKNDNAVTSNTFVIGGSGLSYTRFVGLLDEVKFYRGGITQQQVTADYNDTHPCLLLHHARLDHNGDGLTCAPAQIRVTGCTAPDANGTCPTSVVAFAGTVVAQNNGVTVGSAPFAISAGQSSTLVELNVPNPQTTTLNVVNYSTPPFGNPQTTCWNALTRSPSCQYVFNDAGFIVSNVANGPQVNITNLVAGDTSPTYYLRAVRKNTTTSACEAALQGNQTVNFGYVCNNPTVCSASNLMTITGTGSALIARNNNATGFVNGTAVPMFFDGNGNAPFSLNFVDAGQTTLYMQKTTANGANISGNSNAFVTKPFSLSLSNISTLSNVANPAAADADGARFVKADEPFKATVTALARNGNATPNFGREIAPEVVNINSTLVAPVGGNPGVMSGNSTSGFTFNNGSATPDTLKWSEVGIIRLTPSLADNDYLGAGNVTGNTSENVGRFYPDHFRVATGTDTKACSGQFTYFGQDGLNTAFTVTAESRNNSVTRNYTGTYGPGSFVKFNTTLRTAYNFTTSPVFPLDPSATAITGTWLNGVGSIDAKHVVRKPAARTAPRSIVFQARPVDDDLVTLTTTDPVAISAASPFRYGRMFIQSMHGSELIALPMQLEAQYWDGFGYIRNTLDSCSDVPLESISMKNYRGNLNACETRLSGSANLANGVKNVRLSAPGVTAGIPNTGSVDLNVNLNAALPGERVCVGAAESNASSASMPWLLDNGAEPVGRATFGINKVPVIYMRENF